MEGRRAYISKDGNGRTKLEYAQNDEERIMLWEKKDMQALETLFDGEGAILLQKMIPLGELQLERIIDDTIKREKIAELEERPYSDVRLSKKCPKCGESGLLRHVEAFTSKDEVPIMPLYHCKNCKTSSYYMTDSYLEYLVHTNRELFETVDIKEFENNKSVFMTELKGYVIRIFASKKIMCIK
ncbi:MAG: hypothetical protein ACHQX1_03140 [Candidatus Micrarchaeales archaeon]